MPVVCVFRCAALQKVLHVLKQQGLVLIDHHRERGVSAVDSHLTVCDPRLCYELSHRIGEIDYLRSIGRFNFDDLAEYLVLNSG